MERREKAAQCFQQLREEAGAWHCAVLEREQGALIDAGWDAPGGWMAAKCVLEGLAGGRGQVSYAQRQMEDGMQLPALELFLDDPVGTARAFQRDGQGIYGVRGEAGYVLGVTDRPVCAGAGARGRVRNPVGVEQLSAGGNGPGCRGDIRPPHGDGRASRSPLPLGAGGERGDPPGGRVRKYGRLFCA